MRHDNPLQQRQIIESANNLASVLFPVRDFKAEEEALQTKSAIEANRALAAYRDAQARNEALKSGQTEQRISDIDVVAGHPAVQEFLTSSYGIRGNPIVQDQFAENLARVFFSNATGTKDLASGMNISAKTPYETDKLNAETLAALALGAERGAAADKITKLLPFDQGVLTAEALAHEALAKERLAAADQTTALTPYEQDKLKAEVEELDAEALASIALAGERDAKAEKIRNLMPVNKAKMEAETAEKTAKATSPDKYWAEVDAVIAPALEIAPPVVRGRLQKLINDRTAELIASGANGSAASIAQQAARLNITVNDSNGNPVSLGTLNLLDWEDKLMGGATIKGLDSILAQPSMTPERKRRLLEMIGYEAADIERMVK